MRPLVAIGLVACGRLGFDPDRNATPDADSGDRANLVFVTSTATDGLFAATGVPLQVADAACAARAVAAGLHGTFVAWLSTSTTNALDRLAGSRGWVRTDGVPVLDLPGDFLANRIFNPITNDENGAPLVASTAVWTGTEVDGRMSSTCSDWSSATGVATVGHIGASLPVFTNLTDVGCTTKASLYCFEIGHDVATHPTPPSDGRIAFLGRARADGDTSRALLDQLCHDDATAASLPGTYVAAVASSQGTIASRVTLDAQPWRRVDGTLIAATGTDLFDGSQLKSFVDQAADGTYDTTNGLFYVGASGPLANAGSDCTDWADIGASTAQVGESHFNGMSFWNYNPNKCNAHAHVLCLQQ